MNRVYAATWMLVVVLGTGCPVGGEAGVLHEALLRDEMNRLARGGCQSMDIEELCGPDRFEACMEDCWKRMEKRGRE
jgi:hypothetical protein